MMDLKSLVKPVLGILVAFSIGLVLFFYFSADYGDGLEKTAEIAGVEEGESVYNAPLDYGSDYPTALAMGVIGFFITLLAMLGLGKVLERRNEFQGD